MVDAELGHVSDTRASTTSPHETFSSGNGQFVRRKSLDTFCPLGPWIVTVDEIADPQGLAIECEASGELLQPASTAQNDLRRRRS